MSRPPRESLGEWLAAEPFALAMSAGFFGFFAHTGALQTLVNRGLRPNRMSGASAGALVAGLYASGLEPSAIADDLLSLKRRDFWDPAPGLGILSGRRFRALLEERLVVRDFSACRTSVTVSVYDVLSRRPRALDHGDLARAIHASCAVPIMFHPVWIAGRPYVDGGVTDRPGLSGVPQGARLMCHHLASRSPWRRRNSPALEVPRRANAVTLVIDGLPRIHPFALERGAAAYDRAQSAMEEALRQPIVDGVVRISG
jgi:NTE family protein